MLKLTSVIIEFNGLPIESHELQMRGRALSPTNPKQID